MGKQQLRVLCNQMSGGGVRSQECGNWQLVLRAISELLHRKARVERALRPAFASASLILLFAAKVTDFSGESIFLVADRGRPEGLLYPDTSTSKLV
jgi:hypothetical protein